MRKSRPISRMLKRVGMDWAVLRSRGDALLFWDRETPREASVRICSYLCLSRFTVRLDLPFFLIDLGSMERCNVSCHSLQDQMFVTTARPRYCATTVP